MSLCSVLSRTQLRCPLLAAVVLVVAATNARRSSAIPGAHPARIGEWQAVVQVGRCSGAIIHSSLVIVPAHCLAGNDPGEITWRMAGSKQVGLARIDHCWSHPEYLNRAPEHDIGVCSLLDAVSDQAIARIDDVLHNTEPARPQMVQVVGYGDRSARGQSVSINNASPRSTPSVSLGRIIQVPTEFTISVGTGRKSACFGDSGSAVFANTKGGRFALLGLISGPESGICRGRALAVRIKPHVAWIEATTGHKLASQ